MKILITGSTGLLGQALCRRLSAGPHDVLGVSRHAPRVLGPVRHAACDLSDVGQAAEVITRFAPDAVVHTQAMSDVDRCEREPQLAEAMNAQAVRHVVEALRGRPARLIALSTDYVFDGRKGRPYDEADAPNPLSVYGRSKLRGEAEALRHPQAVVVRTSTLFGPGRINFCDRLVDCLRRGAPVEAFEDQTTSPTYTDDLADGLLAVLATLPTAAPPSRVLHVANAGGCTRLAFAQRVADALKVSREPIRAITIAQQQRPAPRPVYSALTSCYLAAMIGRTLRPWDDALLAYLRQHHCAN